MYRKLVPSTVLAAVALAAPTAVLALSPASTTPAGEEPGFCAPYQAAVAQFSSGEPDPAVATQAVTDMAANVPDEIAEPAQIVIDTATTALGGDPSVFESTPEFFPALGQIDGWMFDNCAFDATYDVVATDYAFGGLPEEIPAGHVAIRLHNEGTEIHEIAIVRKADGVTQSWDEILPLVAAEDPAAMELVERVGAAFSPAPEAPGVAVADLEPGDYAAVCFIPVGSLQGAPEEGAPEETEGAGSMAPGAAEAEPEYDPHFAHGMVQEFTVVEAG